MNPDKYQFIYSTRFWALVGGALTLYLYTKQWIGQPEVVLIETILGGFVGIRTIDRFAEKNGAVDTGVVIASPTPSKVEVPADQGVVEPK